MPVYPPSIRISAFRAPQVQARLGGHGGVPPLFRFFDLYADIAGAQIDGSMPKLKAKLCKPKLLILDDFGMGEMTPAGAQVLLDLADRRKGQWPVEKWHDFFPNPTIADVVLDRIVHNAHRLQLKRVDAQDSQDGRPWLRPEVARLSLPDDRG